MDLCCPAHNINRLSITLEHFNIKEKRLHTMGDAKELSKERLITPVFRLSFPYLFEPRAGKPRLDKNNQVFTPPPKFSHMAIFSPKTFDDAEKALWAKMIQIANEVAVAVFGKTLKDLPPEVRKPFRSGADKTKYGMTAEDVFCNFSSQFKPTIVAADSVTRIAAPKDVSGNDLIYPGCYCRASINCWAHSNEGKGVNLGLFNVMFVRHGERLDNRVEPEEDFGAYATAAAPSAAGALTDADLGL
jgi:hypothetical protein